MRYFISQEKTPNPDIITDNTFSASSIFAVVTYALTKSPDKTLSVNCLSGEALKSHAETDTFLFSTLEPYCDLYLSKCGDNTRKTQVPYGIAGAAWKLFGETVIRRLGGNIEAIDDVWRIIDDEIVANFDSTEHADKTCRSSTQTAISTDDFKQACTMLESWLRTEIRKVQPT
ncbi:hypothetical protein IJ847_02300 [Candidatus Saccharibacteria bacterium]|nr:hypothetical protein [Candidatus Saccharibacteria bacterium]